MTEVLNLRPFDQLNKDEKVEAILAVVMEPVPKQKALEYAGVEFDLLSESDKQKIDQVFDRYQSETEDSYIVDNERRAELSESIDMKSVHAKIAGSILNKISF